MGQLFDEIAAEFDLPSREDWKRSVEKALKGRSFDEVLVTRTAEGLPLEPLYLKDHLPPAVDREVPGAAPYTRGFPADRSSSAPRQGWLRATHVEHPDPGNANAILLDDLQGGVERASIQLVSAARALATDADVSERRGGVWIDGKADLGSMLSGVHWNMAPVALRVSGDLDLLRSVFAWCAELRNDAGAGLSAQLDVVADAIAARDANQDVPASIRALSAELRAEVTRAAGGAHRFDARPILISTEAIRMAGGDVVQEIAAALGAFVAVAKALEAAGIERAAAVRACEFQLATGSDFFTEIAKLRAFRLCFARMLDALGLPDRVGDAVVSATTAEDTLSTRDAYVNLLRGTGQAAAAVFGGADSLVVRPFDLRVNGGSALGRRTARNIQNLLAEESIAGAVTDPAGGSFYVERRTEDLAAAAWTQFAEWEGAGGFLAVSDSGAMRAAVEVRWQARQKRLRSRREAVLGVSVFPSARERTPEAEPFNTASFVARWASRLGTRASAGAPAPAAGAWPRRHVGEDFEALRDESDRYAARAGSPPAAFAALVGAAPSYSARLDWLRDLFAAGGVTLVERPVKEDGSDAAQAFRESGAAGAVVVAADAIHESCIPAVAPVLKRAGASPIVVAGRPGEKDAAFRAAGVTDFVFMGADVYGVLRAVLAPGKEADVIS